MTSESGKEQRLLTVCELLATIEPERQKQVMTEINAEQFAELDFGAFWKKEIIELERYIASEYKRMKEGVDL